MFTVVKMLSVYVSEFLLFLIVVYMYIEDIVRIYNQYHSIFTNNVEIHNVFPDILAIKLCMNCCIFRLDGE